MVVMAAQLRDYNQCHWIVHFKMIVMTNIMLYITTINNKITPIKGRYWFSFVILSNLITIPKIAYEKKQHTEICGI